MKRLILLAILFATTLSLSAQRNMQVWEGNTYSEFFTGDVDSVTFLLSPEGTLRTYATPQFKIENDYWFVSYDEGYHWTQLGKATGEQGPQGEKGDQGERGDKGDSMFLSVTQDDKFIYLLMSDSTKVQIAKSGSGSGGTHTDDDIIEFRDLNVKAALLQYTPTIDTNGDGEISYGEAKAVKELILYANKSQVCSNIISFKEFQYFTSINNFAFKNMENLVEITLPKDIKFIPEMAFENAVLLSSIAIPNECDSIKEGAFKGCANLANVQIPNSVKYIAHKAFDGCASLKSFTFPENYVGGVLQFSDQTERTMEFVWNTIAYPNAYLYQNYKNSLGLIGCVYDKYSYISSNILVSSIIFGEKVEVIPAYLCCGFHDITEIIIPNSVKTIGSNAFEDCCKLSKITIGNKVTEIGESAFSKCISLEKFTIGESIKTIGSSAFNGCTYLAEIRIGKNVNFIGSSAFSNCRLDRIYCEAQQPPILGADAIPLSVSVIYVPRQSVNEYRTIWNKYTNKIIGYDFE